MVGHIFQEYAQCPSAADRAVLEQCTNWPKRDTRVGWPCVSFPPSGPVRKLHKWTDLSGWYESSDAREGGDCMARVTWRPMEEWVV